MSFEMHEAARRTEIPSPAKFVLRSLAWFHNGQTGRCDPSIETIANDCGISKRTVIRQLAILEKCGFLKIESRGARSNSYTLTPTKGKSCWDYKWSFDDNKVTTGPNCSDRESLQSKERDKFVVTTGPNCSDNQSICSDNQSICSDNQSICSDTESPNKEEQTDEQTTEPFLASTTTQPDDANKTQASPSQKKEFVSFEDSGKKKPTGIVATGGGKRYQRNFDFAGAYAEKTGKQPGERLLDLIHSWDAHRVIIDERKKIPWTDLYRGIFVNQIARMETEHGTTIVCDRIEAAICGGYNAVTAPPASVSFSSKRDESDKYSCNQEALDEIPF